MNNHDTSMQSETFSRAVNHVREGGDAAIEARKLFDLLTPQERLSLLDGDQPFWAGMLSLATEGYNIYPYVMGAVDRLGIPGLRFADGPRGSVLGKSTCFPVSMARGATWDVALEEKIGAVIGREIRALGANFFGGVCINLPRHPAWGARSGKLFRSVGHSRRNGGGAGTRRSGQCHGMRQAFRPQ